MAWLAAQRPADRRASRIPQATCRPRDRRSAMSTENGLTRRQLLVKLGLLSTALSAQPLAVPIVRYIFSRRSLRAEEARLPIVALARRTRSVSRRADAPGNVSKPGGESVGRGDGRDCLLGASRRRKKFPGLRDQLRASRVPGPLVPAIGSVHVPVPRRRLLPGRLARLRATRARPVRISATRSKEGNC